VRDLLTLAEEYEARADRLSDTLPRRVSFLPSD
jgi:hypothetical protein